MNSFSSCDFLFLSDLAPSSSSLILLFVFGSFLSSAMFSPSVSEKFRRAIDVVLAFYPEVRNKPQFPSEFFVSFYGGSVVPDLFLFLPKLR